MAVLGLVVNLIAFLMLRDGTSDSINIEGAYLEVLAEALGSVAYRRGAVIQLTGVLADRSDLRGADELFVLPGGG